MDDIPYGIRTEPETTGGYLLFMKTPAGFVYFLFTHCRFNSEEWGMDLLDPQEKRVGSVSVELFDMALKSMPEIIRLNREEVCS